jgi:Zn-dependent protease
LRIERYRSTISSECPNRPRRNVAVFLLEPEETRYDLRWRMLGTAVRVHPMFWLVSLILGFDAWIQVGTIYPFLWVACVFVSVLLHEFGHVLMGRLFGSRGYIVLYSMGGLAVGSNALSRRWQRILVLLAGPGIQLLLFAVIRYSFPLYLQHTPIPWLKPVILVTLMLKEINLYWPLLNLLPIWPLDGGQISREVFTAIMPARGVAVSLGISMVVSGLFAAHMLMASRGRPLLPRVPEGGMFMAFFFAMFCLSSFLALQAENQRRSQWGEDEWNWRE